MTSSMNLFRALGIGHKLQQRGTGSRVVVVFALETLANQ